MTINTDSEYRKKAQGQWELSANIEDEDKVKEDLEARILTIVQAWTV